MIKKSQFSIPNPLSTLSLSLLLISYFSIESSARISVKRFYMHLFSYIKNKNSTCDHKKNKTPTVVHVAAQKKRSHDQKNIQPVGNTQHYLQQHSQHTKPSVLNQLRTQKEPSLSLSQLHTKKITKISSCCFFLS